MIPLQPPELSGSVQNQLMQLRQWAAVLVQQLQMMLSDIGEDALSQAVREKLNQPDETTRKELEQFRAYMERTR